MTKNSFTYISDSEQKTKELGEKLASISKRGDIFALFGTLGMGKSVLSRAFIQKLTNVEEVPSPTFTLVQGYPLKDYQIYHFDLYRLKSQEEIFELGFEEAAHNDICLIEWPQNMGSYLPADIFSIEIIPFNNERKITISATSPEKISRLEKLFND